MQEAVELRASAQRHDSGDRRSSKGSPIHRQQRGLHVGLFERGKKLSLCKEKVYFHIEVSL